MKQGKYTRVPFHIMMATRLRGLLGVTPTDILILLELLRMTYTKAPFVAAWPKGAELARGLGLTKEKVSRGLRKWHELGFLRPATADEIRQLKRPGLRARVHVFQRFSDLTLPPAADEALTRMFKCDPSNNDKWHSPDYFGVNDVSD